MYQFIAFGKSTISLPGTGLWVAGTSSPHDDTYYYSGSYPYKPSYEYSRPCQIYMNTSGQNSYVDSGSISPALFWLSYRTSGLTTYQYSDRNCWLHSNLDTNYPWSLSSSNYYASRSGVSYLSSYLQTQPQQFNREALLLPIFVYKSSHQYSGSHLIASLINARHIKINYIDPETVLNKGEEQWVVFPCFRKVYQNEYWTSNSSSGETHSGNFGWAVKKEA